MDSLDFELNYSLIPDGFIKGDIRVNFKRHIILMTAAMLSLMGNIKTWYIDGTFKIIKKPFKQLFGIHRFIKHGDCIKQIPVAYIMMSGKAKKYYIAVFRHINGILPGNNVSRFILDFEKAACVYVA